MPFLKGQIAWNKGTHGVMKPNATSFQKGQRSWNEGTKGVMKPNSGSFKRGHKLNQAKPRIEKQCPKCEKIFYVKPSLLRVVCCSLSCARKGLTPRLGIKSSPEARMKMRLSHLGFRGEKHWNWKGGSPRREKGQDEHIQWRKQVFKRDNFTCQACYATKVVMNAHHIKPWVKFPHLRHDLDNGITLCIPCHKECHGKVLTGGY
jgi:hypothetical protein